MAGKARQKAKAALALMVKQPADSEPVADSMHGSRPEDEQCALALAKAFKDEDAGEILQCLKSLFNHFDASSGEADEVGD